MNQFEPREFEATHWSVVLAAAQESSTRAEAAMEQLCRAYWPPLAVFLLRQGYSEHDAQDLTQAFFEARIVTRGIFKGASPQRGKFRSWLLRSFQNFLRNEWDRKMALKRGGDVAHLPLDSPAGQNAANGDSAAGEFDRAFSLAVLNRALAHLEQREQLAGKAGSFSALRAFLPGGTGGSYSELARCFGKSEEALRVEVNRLRRQFGSFVRAEIARTVSSPEEVQEELRYFLTLWRRPETPL